MKKTLATLMIASFAGASFAGTKTTEAPCPTTCASKNPVLTVPEPQNCFNAGEWTFETGVAGIFVDGAEVAGGAIGLTKFLTNTIGIGADYSVYAEGVHVYNANLVLRAPIESACLALYAIGGVGGISDGSAVLTASAGVGVELRCFANPNAAIFVDARYFWIDDYSGFGGIDDAVVARAGLRINF